MVGSLDEEKSFRQKTLKPSKVLLSMPSGWNAKPAAGPERYQAVFGKIVTKKGMRTGATVDLFFRWISLAEVLPWEEGR